ncbi:hypothetical protein CONPUDRAFT_85966 [Coniophora puteana RWD-64-598 SS2]|uniref:Uncharacterized protein n=1 Tax=Coniophora puteana (strain RWD-64-598) TaxID=741705 RepID=R7SDL2_CONPW|nr:uncharacterized protein CONPUDRAFT_85966 [Coniophora puteana RWD-64-598 SS2]EIW74241.1 hypothetical protein CONPUDRAFT_85966 [Coniophora puteana RWD-64-598 SS2]
MLNLKSSASVFLIQLISQNLLVILLQGMLSLRVWILFGKDEKLRYFLLCTYFLAQATNLIASIFYWVVIPREFADGHAYSLAGLEWTSPAGSSALLAYEILLSVLALYYALKHLPRGFWRDPAKSTRMVASVTVRDNLIYFFVALTELIGNIFSNRVMPIDTALAYWGIEHILQVMFLTMTGPWMILDLRRRNKIDLDGRTSRDIELSDLMFRRGIIPSTDTEETAVSDWDVNRV